jgi:hypothetical protein
MLREIRDKPTTGDKEDLSRYGHKLIKNIQLVGDHIKEITRSLPSPDREKKRRHLWYPSPKSNSSNTGTGVSCETFGLRLFLISDYRQCTIRS